MIPPPLDVNAAARLSTAVQLRDVAFLGLEAKHLGTGDGTASLSLSFDVPNATAIWHVEGSQLTVVLPLIVFIDGVEAETQAKHRLAEISVVFRLLYDLTNAEAASSPDLPHYVGISGYLHAWPYFRAEVQTLTSKLGFPPLVLPVIVSGHAAKSVTVMPVSEVQAKTLLPKAGKPANAGARPRRKSRSA